ncbi:MAG: hypothetical protein IPJ27_06220 [Candidatus Accumulibacter sp.]|uniref:Uncharacterized protein n=1 Tax=Candidatus Accumulibacter proximus TaxID=2954385 RepID=A0A935PYS1_9PROT|nr:hypothetical protein [Candidatus Accumulibacter proximus]
MTSTKRYRPPCLARDFLRDEVEMSTALERRTAKLEQAAHPGANQIDIIIRRVIGTVGDEIVRAVIGDHVVDRHADEAEDVFVERSKAEALARTDRRPCRIILHPNRLT